VPTYSCLWSRRRRRRRKKEQSEIVHTRDGWQDDLIFLEARSTGIDN
jgi:hypothetical protein